MKQEDLLMKLASLAHSARYNLERLAPRGAVVADVLELARTDVEAVLAEDLDVLAERVRA